MATPQNDSYAAASGVAIQCGRYGLPVWRRAVLDATWGTAGSATITQIDPANDPAINPSYPSAPPWGSGVGAVVSAWCGACWDESTGTLWLPLGGGHVDYGGNEAYRQTLQIEAPLWSRPRNPSGAIGNLLTTNDGQEATGNYADGQPRAIHSYNKHVWVPGVGPVCTVQGNCYYSGQAGTNRTMRMDPDTGIWTYPTTFTYAAASHSGDGACYDPSRHAIWHRYHSDGRISMLDIATWAWSTKTSFPYDSLYGYKKLIYLPEYDVVVQLDASTALLRVWDVAAGTLTSPGLSGTMPTGLVMDGTVGADWTGSQIVLWNNTSNTTTISTLTPTGDPRSAAWAWGQLTVSGSNTVVPSAKAGNGTYGRFGYSKKLGGCYLLNDAAQPTYFFAMN